MLFIQRSSGVELLIWYGRARSRCWRSSPAGDFPVVGGPPETQGRPRRLGCDRVKSVIES